MDKCIEWIGGVDGHGYGRIFVNGKNISTHRLALILKLGRNIHSGMCALHRCHNPKCVNPNHLYEGTHRQNTHDMLNSKRHSYGEKHGKKIFDHIVTHGKSKYSPESILKIKEMFQSGLKLKEVQKKTGIAYSYLQKIKYGFVWKHLTP